MLLIEELKSASYKHSHFVLSANITDMRTLLHNRLLHSLLSEVHSCLSWEAVKFFPRPQCVIEFSIGRDVIYHPQDWHFGSQGNTLHPN